MVFGLFKKSKNKENKRESALYQYVKVKDKIKQTDDSVTIIFEQPDEKLIYKAGQYITCVCNIDDKEERRSYSLNSSPFSEEPPAITIKRDKEGKVSNYFIDHVKPGDELKIIRPMGNFTTDFNPDNQRHLVLIGAGSGITPLMSLLTSALYQEPQSKVTLIYGNRYEDQVIFKDQLDDLTEKYSGRFLVHHIISQPSDNWQGLKGRLNAEILKSLTKELIADDKTEFYLCGPQGMMQTTEEYLESVKVPKEKIRKESFVASPEIKEVKVMDKDENQEKEVTVLLDGEEFTFKVQPGDTILETALDHDIDMPYSCQSGICTTCRCKMISGEIEMEETEGLTDEELQEGYVLVCVGRPVTENVKLSVE